MKFKQFIKSQLHHLGLINKSTCNIPNLKIMECIHVTQVSLVMQYKLMAAQNASSITFNDVGFRVFSQNDEDGILLFVFSLIGTTNKKCVEICAGDGIECNTANLIINHGWHGLLFDGNEDNIKKCNAFYLNNENTKYWPPKAVKAWITKDNINQLVQENHFKGEIDLLSLDIDGNDYWIWEALNIINPRVIILEFNHLWGTRKAVSTPYSPNFQAEFTQYGSDYGGASLPAFMKLAKTKGYYLVGTNAIATNAIFIRNDIKNEYLKEIAPETCFNHPRAQFGIKTRYVGIKDKNWIEV